MKKKSCLGPYQIDKLIGKGGMGEVFLAIDPICNRKIAIKKMNDDLVLKQPLLKKRFLQEAKIASQLTHPSILPIYSIHKEKDNLLYYTMPYIEGQTLKELLLDAKNKEKEGKTPLAKHSIGTLMLIFLHICEALSYSHAKKILHRDIKPDNILVGKYGEVLILDWGIATYIGEKEDDINISINKMTKPGKIAGTLSYLAPERILGRPSSIQTEIFSLGVILYQILTLSLPFKRTDLNKIKKVINKEKIKDPLEVAPYRDIPHPLIFIVKKCLDSTPSKRYQNMELLIQDIKNYLEGQPQWQFLHTLQLKEKTHWQLQENVMLTKHTAITQHTDIAEWVNLMVAKDQYFGNIKIEATIEFHNNNQGLGFLLCMPEKKPLEEGYCFWLSSSGPNKLLRSFVLTKDLSSINLKKNKFYHLCIEKIDNHIKLSINNEHIVTYTDYFLLKGPSIGLIFKDNYFSISNFNIFSSSHTMMINCLAVPEAFFTKKQFFHALNEYRRIHHSFPGRAEGREAIFRSGITLLEIAKQQIIQKEKHSFFSLALDEFSKLHNTPGEPLEYLGKSFVYATNDEAEEEAKCLELGLRKFNKHPLREVLEEYIIFRIHESSLNNREATYRLLLIAIRLIPSFYDNTDTKLLLSSLMKHWENIFFLPSTCLNTTELSIQLAYRIYRIPVFLEIANQLLKNPSKKLVLVHRTFIFSLLHTKDLNAISSILNQGFIEKAFIKQEIDIIKASTNNFSLALQQLQNLLSTKKTYSLSQTYLLFYFLQLAIDKREIFHPLYYFSSKALPKEYRKHFDYFLIHLLLLDNNFLEARKIFDKYPLEQINDETNPLHPLYGCYLTATEEPDISHIHFSKVLDTPFPPTSSLLSHYFVNKIDDKKSFWFKRAFFWEKQELFRQLSLFYHCKKEKLLEKKYLKLLSKKPL